MSLADDDPRSSEFRPDGNHRYSHIATEDNDEGEITFFSLDHPQSRTHWITINEDAVIDLGEVWQ